MESLLIQSNEFKRQVSLEFKRYLYHEIEWSWRLIGIVGARGTGKTTMVLQYLKEHFKSNNQNAIYISLDDFYFTNNTLIDFIKEFRQKGGVFIAIDEVHKYPGWAREIKNAYDRFPDINIVFTGSSILEILQLDVDLSRRAVVYRLSGLSFREYLEMENICRERKYSLDEILSGHHDIAYHITEKIKPLAFFSDYLRFGYYPYYSENRSVYYSRLSQTMKLIIENDLRLVKGYDPGNARKIEQLLYILAGNVPFKPNITKLSEKIGVYRSTLVRYLHYLAKAEIINLLFLKGISTSTLQKPEKIFLNNTNIAYMLCREKVNQGSIRESFFLSQIQVFHNVSLPKKSGDFLVDDTYLFEIGGSRKTNKQIKNEKQAFIVSDDIEIGALNKIPLWLFGFLY